MDSNRFDAFVRSFTIAAPRRSALAGLLGGGLAALLTRFGSDDAEAKKRRKKKKKCKRSKKKCGKQCIPKANCCQSADCGVNEKCTNGACEPCLPQGTACTDDAQCCTGICDTYTNKCQQVRVDCESDDQCPGGSCCGTPPNMQCLYVTATQGACVPDGEPDASCGYLLCGDNCNDLNDGTYEYCGFDGSAACRKGRCCCPKGIPIEDCSNVNSIEPIPRCT